MPRRLSAAALLALVVACGGGTTAETPSAGSPPEIGDAGPPPDAAANTPVPDPLGTYRDGCDEAACGARPPPKHQCVGGYPASVCTKARGACGWQVDCVAEPPPDYDGNVGVSPCGDATTGEQCGPQPSWDDKDCVYGFIAKPQCERYGGAACAWSRRCGPRPCSETGTCNTLDRSKLGAACDIHTPCPSGYSCASITVNIGEYIPPTCVEGNSCPLTCAAGKSCVIAESYPAQISCAR